MGVRRDHGHDGRQQGPDRVVDDRTEDDDFDHGFKRLEQKLFREDALEAVYRIEPVHVRLQGKE